MSVRVTLVCHGSTTALRRGLFSSEEGLDAVGRQRAHAAGFTVRGGAAWCGPEPRTTETAALLGLQAVAEGALRDCDFGAWSGRALVEVAGADPEGLEKWVRDRRAAPHGGETLAAVNVRVADWLTRVAATAPARRTVAVTHPAVIRSALAHVLGLGPAADVPIDIQALTVVELTHHHGRFRLRSLSRL